MTQLSRRNPMVVEPLSESEHSLQYRDSMVKELIASSNYPLRVFYADLPYIMFYELQNS